MRKTRFALLAAIPAAILAVQLQADDGPGPHPRGGPGMFFQRLDRNNDGKIEADEVPEGAPQFVKDMLKKADKNEDKTITADELRAAAAQARPDSPNAHFRGPRPDGRPQAGPPSRGPSDAGRGPRPEAGPPSRGPSGSPSAHRGPRPDGRPQAGPPSRGPSDAGRGPRPEAGPHAVSPQRPDMDPKAIFLRLDRNKDRQLSPEEFALGMKALHSRMGAPGHPAVGPRAGRGPRPEAGHSRSPIGRRSAMRRSYGHRPMGGVHGRSRDRQRAPMASHALRGWPHRAMGSRTPFGGLGRPSAPWQGRSQGMQRFGRGPQAGSRGARPGTLMAGRLKEADKNDDGKISKSEAPDGLKQNFDRVDADKDGQLDRAEIAKAAVAVRKKLAASVADKRREAFSKRIEAARKARVGAEHHQPKKPQVRKAAEKKPVEKKKIEKKVE